MRPALACGLLSLALAAVAAVFDGEPLWVAAVMLGVLGAGSAAWVALAARGVSVRRTLGERRVVEDEPVSIVIDVRTGTIALPTATIVDPLLAGPAPFRPGAGPRRVRIQARFARRGLRSLVPPRLRIADPLGLATREIAAPPSVGEDELLVLPRIESITAAHDGGDGAWLARVGHPAIGAEAELDGIRPLREGTSAARIFWPSIARAAEPQERRLSRAAERLPLVVLDPQGAASEEQLDAAVRAAASLAHALARSGGCSLLLPGDRRATTLEETLGGWSQVHARLALLGSQAGPALGSVSHRNGAIIYVSARLRARLPAALGPAAGAARVLVVPGVLPAGQAAFAVAGCRGYVLHAGRRRAARGAHSASASGGLGERA